MTIKKEHDVAHEMPLAGRMREIIFGADHGIVSILALLTGIATASKSSLAVIVTGIIALVSGAATLLTVEYLAAKSQKASWESFLDHEREEFKRKPKHEIEEMRNYYQRAGFSKKETAMLIAGITKSEKRWIEAHATHILQIFPNKLGSPFKDALWLAGFHVIGGLIPLVPYLVFSQSMAIVLSISLSLVALFFLGVVANGKKRHRAGLEMVVVASIAVLVSYGLGTAINVLIG